MVANNSTTSESSRIQEDNISDDEWYQSLFEDDAQEDGAGVGASDTPKDKNVETLKMVVSKLLTRISRLEAKRADPTPTQNTGSEESTPPIDDIKFDELKASATVSLAFNKCGASGYLSPLSVIYSKVSIPSSTYNATWASTVPQLREYYLTRKGGDPLAPIRTAKNAEDFTAALQKVTMDLEQVHDLTLPVIVCLLLCEMDNTQDTLVKIKANDIATCCLTAPDVKSIEETLRNIADSDSDVMMPDLPYDTDFDSLPGNSLICPHKHALWTRILYTVTKVWTRMYLGYVTPDDVKWKWTSIRQKKDEWISQFLARERQAWQGLSSCLSFRKMQLPSGYDRAVQLLSAVNSDLRKGYNDYIRTERLDVDTLRYEDVANQLVIIETTQSMKFPWDQSADQANKAQSKKGNTKHESGGGKWSGGGTGGKWAGGGNGGKWSGGNGGKWSNGGKWHGGAKVRQGQRLQQERLQACQEGRQVVYLLQQVRYPYGRAVLEKRVYRDSSMIDWSTAASI
ncbi:hypothetical protein FOZ60_001210 [Perkinsus olseni]|uniref:Uncharacterized protein n=2 Tax=Perkinsus olseni TaxID=32597 RepID=A0A7J6P0V6_PEROL|nr:hypothetical protein FOZ60_001210 [Perkinsus olseni]